MNFSKLTQLFEEPTETDRDIIAQQIGRFPRGLLLVKSRCVCDNPAVVSVKPRLEDGTPFPTLYWLTLKSATKAVSTLEALGIMRKFSELLKNDPELMQAYQQSHRNYIGQREQIAKVEEIHQISAGGMPNRVKCLHALLAHTLAVGPNINPIGDLTLRELKSSWSLDICQCD